MNNRTIGTYRSGPLKKSNICKTRAITDTIRSITEITPRAAGVLEQPLQNKLPVDQFFVAKPIIQNRVETAVIIITVSSTILPDIRMFDD
jgi:hypothetical protein